MKLSVCIGVYNAADVIIETLTAIKNQTYTDFECILVDDHSEDSTPDLIIDFIKTDDRFKLFLNLTEPAKPYVDSHNKSYELGSAEYLLRLDQDDIPKADMFEKFVKFMDEHPEYDMVSSGFQNINGKQISDLVDERRDRREDDILHKYEIEEFVYDYQIDNALWANQCSCIRKSFLDLHNVKFEEAKLGDVMFWWRMLANGANPGFIPEKLLYYRNYEYSSSHTTLYCIPTNDVKYLYTVTSLKMNAMYVWYKRTNKMCYKYAFDKYKYVVDKLTKMI